MKLNLKVIISIFYLLQNSSLIFCMPPSKVSDNQWFISARTGMSLLLQEVTPGFKFLQNEFSHQPGLTLDFTFGRNFNAKWEPGINFSLYRLTGHSDLPGFSAVDNHYAFINLYQLPVEYVTVATSVSALLRYYFLNNALKSDERASLQPYAEIGAGISYFFTEMGYSAVPPQDASQVIFYKGTQESGPGPGNVAQILAGLGTKAVLPGNLDLIISLNADIVNYDLICCVIAFLQA